MKRSTKTAGHISKHVLKANGPPTGEPWVWFSRAMLESPAMLSLSRYGRLALDRICLEHMAQGGLENGRLKVTFRDFQAFGIHNRHVAAAIAEIESVGLAVRTFPGRRTCGEDRGAAAQYRLTWLPVIIPIDLTPATNEWKGFGDGASGGVGGVGRVAVSQPSRLHTLRQDIEGATQRGGQKNSPKTGKNGKSATHRGVQKRYPTRGAEEKNLDAASVHPESEVLH